jgi:hypothetical protein
VKITIQISREKYEPEPGFEPWTSSLVSPGSVDGAGLKIS